MSGNSGNIVTIAFTFDAISRLKSPEKTEQSITTWAAHYGIASDGKLLPITEFIREYNINPDFHSGPRTIKQTLKEVKETYPGNRYILIGDIEQNTIENIEGVGDKTAKLLQDNGYQTIQDITDSTTEKLQEIKGIGDKKSDKIFARAQDLANETADPTQDTDWEYIQMSEAANKADWELNN